MALAFTSRAAVGSATDATSYATSAFTPSASAGIIVAVGNSKAAAPDTPTLDSPSWLSGSWTQEGTVVFDTDAKRLTVFSGRTVSSPGSAALTASFGATQIGNCLIVIDVTDEDETDFVLQPTTRQGAGNQDPVTITLPGALAAATSANLAFCLSNASTHAPGGGETEIGSEAAHATPITRMSVQFELNDTASTFDFDAVARNAQIALEIVETGTPPAAEMPIVLYPPLVAPERPA